MIPPQKEILHEYQGDQHRIVIVDRSQQGERRTEGAWVPYAKFASHRGFIATSAYWEGELPVGIFRLNPIPHKVVELKEDKPP